MGLITNKCASKLDLNNTITPTICLPASVSRKQELYPDLLDSRTISKLTGFGNILEIATSAAMKLIVLEMANIAITI